jgi:phage shock protein A
METNDEHLEVLRAIWREMKTLNGAVNDTNAGLAQTNARLDQTNARLDQTNTRLELGFAETNARVAGLERRQTEVEIRLSTELVAVVTAVREVRDLLRDGRTDARRVDRLEERVEALEKKSA